MEIKIGIKSLITGIYTEHAYSYKLIENALHKALKYSTKGFDVVVYDKLSNSLIWQSRPTYSCMYDNE